MEFNSGLDEKSEYSTAKGETKTPLKHKMKCR